MNDEYDKQHNLTTVWTGKTFSAILLAWLLSIIAQVFVNVQLMGNITPQIGLFSLIFSAVFLFIGWSLAKIGRPKTGVFVIVIMGGIGSLVAILTRGGLIVPVTQGYMTTILLVGFVVGKRPGFVSAILIALLYTVIFLAERNGFVTSLPTLRLSQTYLFLLTRLTITATFTYFAAEAIENAFTELSKSNVDLQQSHTTNIQFQKQLEQTNTALEAANVELQGSESRYRAIVNALGDAYFIVCLPDMRIIDANEAGCDMLGYTREELLELTCLNVNVDWSYQSDLQAFYDEILNNKNNKNSVLQRAHYLHKDNSEFPVEVRGSLIELDGDPAIFVIVRDMSEREQSRARVEAALHEKEVLLREVHHRVKNNLQIVNSLMRTSARKFPNEPLIQSELYDLESRVRSMATIHQQLYESRNFAQIEFGTYVRKLVTDISQTHIDKSKNIALEFNLQPVNLSLETAIPAGLIINELVINAIKHGYPPEQDQGVIRCELTVDDNTNEVLLTVANNGLPFDVNKATGNGTTGIQMVDLLVRQIGGKLTVTIENGMSRFMLSFQPREERIPK